MPQLTPQQFSRAERLFFEAGQLPPEQRPAFVRAQCADDPAVADEVEQLLRAADDPPSSIAPLLEGVKAMIAAGALHDADLPAGEAHPDPRRLVGSRVGAYEVTALIGHGGMGVVYRARDTRLGRAVAIKSLPPAFTRDPSRLNRFRREAKLLACLSHPNVATVYGLEESPDHALYLVMELVEGKPLSERLARGPMPIADALLVCRGVAEAVEAAHEAGVIHRDLKPANVMCTPEGRVKVLDFGIAREVKPAVQATPPPNGTGTVPHVLASGDTTQAHDVPRTPTTRDGAVIGTPGYMSPEQVRGQPVDRRTDVFALGCILYECLTGKLAFGGKTDADVVVQILDREPRWDALPPRTPESVRRVLRRCLAKDAARRARDVGDVRIELDEAIAAREWTGSPPAARNEPDPRRRLPWVVAALAVSVAVTLATWLALRGNDGRTTDVPPPPPHAAGPLRRFTLPFPGNVEQHDLPRVRVGLSRDGTKLALTAVDPATQRPELYVRGREDVEFQRVDGAGDAFSPSFSPDGEWVLFNVDGIIRKKRLAGGNAVPVVDVSGFWGPYEWGTDGYLTIAPQWGVGVGRTTAAGAGTLEYVTSLDPKRDEVTHISPCLLPDNSAVLFAIWYGWDDVNVEAVDLRTRQRKPVVRRATCPRFARTPGGDYLLFERAGTVYAAPFDVRSLAVTGPEVPLVDNVLFVNAWWYACYDVADDGTLAYVGGPAFDERNQLTWVDLGPGAASPTTTAPATTTPATASSAAAVDASSDRPAYVRRPFGPERHPFAEVVFSADGRRFSCIFKSKQYHLYVYDFDRRTFDRVITEGDVTSAALSPDGGRIAYSATRDGFYSLYVRRLSDGRSAKVFQGSTNYQNQVEWSPDGAAVMFSMSSKVTEPRDVWVVDVTDLPGDGAPAPPAGAGRLPRVFAGGPAEQRAPRFSPNGKWVAFSSSELGGRRDVFLRSYPDGAQRRQITFGGGDWPDWSPDGDTLYYKAAGRIMAVPVSQETGDLAGRPAVVYDRRFGQIDWELHDYTVYPDPATRRLMIIELSDEGPRASQVNVVLNWPELLARRAAE